MKTERIFACLFIVSVILKISNISGEGILMTVTLMGLTALYSVFGFYFFSVNGIRNQNIVLSILGGICLSFGLLGILFRLQFWVAARIMSLNGSMFSFVAVLLAIIIKANSNRDDLRLYYSNMIGRSVIIFVFTLSLYIMPNRVLAQVVHFNDPKAVELLVGYLENESDSNAKNAYRDYIREQRTKQ